jgi:hypothetical protein
MVKYDKALAIRLEKEKQQQRILEQANSELARYKQALESTLQDVQKATAAQNAALDNSIEVNAKVADMLIESLSEAKQNRFQRAKSREKLDKFREGLKNAK